MKNSLAKVDFIPDNLQKKGLTECFAYSGPSMMPTLKPGQLLYIRPHCDDIQAGDVLVFLDPVSKKYIVHRVVSILASGFIMRGDNNHYKDPLAIKKENIVGRVEMIEKDGKIENFAIGKNGFWMAQFRWSMQRINMYLRWIFRLPYQWLKSSGLVALVWHPDIVQIKMETPDGLWIKYIHRNKTVASLRHNRFQCQKPYDLVLKNQN